MCHAQHLSHYLEGQGHSMTLQQNRVRPITLLFEVNLKPFHINDHQIETMCHAQHLGCYLEGQGHSMTFQQNNFQPITLLFEVEYYNYFTGMVTILRQCVMCNIWVATLRPRSQHDLVAKSCLA